MAYAKKSANPVKKAVSQDSEIPTDIIIGNIHQKNTQAKLADSAKPENLDFGKEYYGGGHPAQINDFIAAIQEKRAPYVSLEDAASTARVILEIYAPFRKV
jgi:predicted dehydrogenase